LLQIYEANRFSKKNEKQNCLSQFFRTINERLKVEKMLEYPQREQIYLETDEYMQPGVTYAIRIK